MSRKPLISRQSASLNLESDTRDLLLKATIGTQEEICKALQEMGHDINQSKASRLLRKIGAIKSKNELGQIVYRLSKEPAPPTPKSSLSHLIIDIVHNEVAVVVHTSPGSASLIARLLDHHQTKAKILGTVAGDDTILIIPKETKNIEQTFENIKKVLLTLDYE